MNAWRARTLGLIVLLVTPGLLSAQAQQPPDETAQTGEQAASPADEDELQQLLREARQRLEQAVRDIGELSSRMATQFDDRPMARLGTLVDRMWFPDAPRATLGVLVTAPREDDEGAGALVTGVTPGGPADEAGVQVDDLIVALNGEPLAGGPGPDRRLVERMREVEPGDTVTLSLRRDGGALDLEVVTREVEPPTIASALAGAGRAAFGAEGAADAVTAWRGIWPVAPAWQPWSDMELAELSPDLGRYFSVDGGLLVVRAPRDRVLALRDGDVILSIGGRTPNDVGHALRILNSYAGGESLQLDIMRDHRAETLDLQVPQREAGGTRRLLRGPGGTAIETRPAEGVERD